ncbi:VOC family protein [Allosphingosinicella sp.]|uniref:VOC family protein n=1 Tax=Allosphingosinicella sp. TaxID=2823234 RepID=UPI003D7046A7
MIFVNLPVTDLEESKAFYSAIGATNNPQFTDETAAMMSFSEAVNVMLLTHEKYNQFTSKKIVDAKSQSEVLLALSRDNRGAVDAITEKARQAGAVIDPTPQQDYGFMYGRSFEDPDGHIWEVMWMDVEAAQAAMAGETAEA